MRNISLFALIGIFVAGCGGGGGGGSSPTDPDAVFPTAALEQPDVGESLRFDLRGSGSAYGETRSINGSVSLSRRPNQVIGGEEFIVVDLVLVVRIPSENIAISSSGTSYFTLDGDFVRTEEDDGVICFPDFNYNEFPDSVMYGDSGNLGRQNCSDGISISSSYLVEVSDRNRSWAAIRQFATVSAPGQADLFEEIVYHVSTDGRLRDIDVIASDGEISFDLRS